MTDLRSIPSLLLASALLLACGGEAPPEAAATPPPATPASSPPPSADDSLGLLSSRGPVAVEPGGEEAGGGAADGDARTIVAPFAEFTLPAGWSRVAPSSSMRLAQARVDGAGGPGELTVFHFGIGGGGPVEQNLARWIGQVEATPGTEPRRETFTVNPFRITLVEVEGTLKPSTMGVGPTTPQPDSRLLAAVVEGPGGPWFFKLTGPASTLAAARDDFVTMLKSVTARP